MVAAAQRRAWLADLAHRRLETAKLRAVCTYIAATMQLAEGADNVMLAAATDLHLGTGTEPAGQPATLPGTGPGNGPGNGPGDGLGGGRAGAPMPAARIPYEQLADAPAAVRPGQPAAVPEGIRELPFELFGSFLVGGQ